MCSSYPLLVSFCSISLIEPGPVITEFERKLYEEAADMDLSAVDKETLDIFQGFYMAYSKDVFTALGQTPEEVAEVGPTFPLTNVKPTKTPGIHRWNK